MNTKLPTTPGPYWFREKDGDEWELVYIREDSTVPGYEYTVLFPETGVEIDFPDLAGMQGQWAKAHTPDEGGEVYLVCDGSGRPIGAGSDVYEALQNFLQCSTSPEADFIALKNKCGYTCEPVTIYRKGRNDGKM